MGPLSDYSEFACDIDHDRSRDVSRRAFSAGLAISIFLSGCRASETATARPDERDERNDPDFLRLSIALTGYPALDPVIAGCMSSAFGRLAPDLKRRFSALASLSSHFDDPKLLLAAARPLGLAEPALAIIAAWYTGTIGTGPAAISVAYRNALMQRPVADALAPPTYQLGGPAWWVAPPPPVRVSAPVAVQPEPVLKAAVR